MSVLKPTNIDELVENAMLELGAPVIRIDVAPIQATKAAMTAIDLFVDYHMDGTEHVFIAQQVSNEDIENNYLTTPKNVHDVIRVLGIHRFPPVYGFGCGRYYGTGGMFGSISPLATHPTLDGGLVSLYLASAHKSYFESILFPNIPIKWNATSRRIRFQGDIRQATRKCGEYVVYEARIVNESDEFGCENPDGEGSSFYQNSWLQRMTSAQIKLIWGNNLSKFQSISLVGGGAGFEFSGETIKNEAKEEIRELKEELFNNYVTPPHMIIG